jgi:hypothetical protein
MRDNTYCFKYVAADREVEIKQVTNEEDDNIYKVTEVFVDYLRALSYSEELIGNIIKLEELEY